MPIAEFFYKNNKYEWIEFPRGQRPLIVFLGEGAIGVLLKFCINELSNYCFVWHSPYDNQIHETFNIPRYLTTLRVPRKHTPIPKNGVYFINTTATGRQFLRDNMTIPEQKTILHAKRELDFVNTSFLFFLEEIPNDLERREFIKILADLYPLLREINKKIKGPKYEKFIQRNNYDEIFNNYIQLGQITQPEQRKTFLQISDDFEKEIEASRA